MGGENSDPIATLIFHIFASFAQFERELIGQRVKDGLAAKKANGVVLGRPRNEEIRNTVLEMLNQGKSQGEIARELDITQPYVSRIKREYLNNWEDEDYSI